MSETKEILNAAGKVIESSSKISTTKLLIIIGAALIMGVFIWSQINISKLAAEISISNNQIGKMMRSQIQFSMIKSAVNRQLDHALAMYDGELGRELMEFAVAHNMQFNQELNAAITGTKAEMIKIKDILIFPEKEK